MLKQIINKIKSNLPLAGNKPMDRWSATKLAEVKAYLENKYPRIWDREDHYLSVEFVIQRYLPADEERTQAQYDASINDLKRKIDRNIDYPNAPKHVVKDDPELAIQLEEILGTKAVIQNLPKKEGASMAERTNKLDRLIYTDICNMQEGDNVLLSYTNEGYSDLETENRLKALAGIGAIRINESIGQTTVTAITQSGRDFFNAILMK